MIARLQDRRFWLGGGLVAALLLAAASWLLLIGPERSSADDLASRTDQTRTANDQLLVKIAALRERSTRLPQYRAELRQAMAALPFDSGMPAFTRQISAQAAAAHVSVDSVGVSGISAANAAGTAVEGAAPATSDGGTAQNGATQNGGTQTGATQNGATQNGATQNGATQDGTGQNGTGNIYAVQVTIASDGSLAHQLAFLHALQYGGARRALVTNAQFTPGTGATTGSVDAACKLTVSLTVFSAPATGQQIAQLTKLLH